ncbi:MAG: hypothetical protein PF569_00325 [Candidatus Woesearchaeota archaeon]|jgi:NTP pyrophosphatase (non-canonical NTP hydrolase)|nr:hypothetical protein [Candidatus Woesearchaeota archaeon]
MTFKDYITEAKKTITFDSNEKLLFCCTTGLLGEYSEYIEHLSIESSEELLGYELGDICWYIAVLSDHLGLELESLGGMDWIGDLQDDGYMLIGKTQEYLKKSVRDNNWKISIAHTNYIYDLLEKLLDAIKQECRLYDLTLSDILEANVKKLKSRQERNALQGSGDKR